MALVAPPTDRTPPVLAPSVVDEPRGISIPLEYLLYFGLLVLAVIMHLHALGNRALHHDETLHAAYSWRIYQNQGYTHDPLLHGPFLYYITALGYFLFGDTDFTARITAALFGIALVLLPWLLRRDLGRRTALIASAYLLISPVSLYVGRFIRHDIYAVVFELLSVAAILRYVATERPIWHYTLAAAMGLMLTTMESFYLFLAIIGSFVLVWVLWQVSRRALLLLAAYGTVALMALRLLTRQFGPLPLPTEAQALDVRHQPDNDWAAYFGKVGAVLGPMFSHPVGLTLLIATIALIVGLILLVFVQKGADGRSAWRRVADSAPRGSLVGALDRIPAQQWAIAFGIAFVIYAVLYTGVLSNPATPNITALVTGISGSFLYWLGQHGVQRGNQPPHFYVFLLSVYEPLLLLFGTLGIGVVARRVWIVLRPRPARQPRPAGTRLGAIDRVALAPALLLWWSLGALLIYSWAGEKMPWLTLHMVVPLTLLSAWTLARLWQWAVRLGWSRLSVILTLIAGALVLLCFNRFTTQVRAASAGPPLFLLPLLGISIVLLLAAVLTLMYNSPRPGVLALLALVLSFGTLFTLRSAIRLAYVNGDVAVEPMVFVQTSPDVPRVMEQLRQASIGQTGKLDLPIRFDNETIWDWYLRNYTATDGSRNSVVSVTDDVQAVFLLDENQSNNAANLDGFVQQRYPLRWWFPECAVYRFPGRDSYCGSDPAATSVLSRFLSQPTDAKALGDYWQFWFDRKLPERLGSTDWILYVRPGLTDEFGIGTGTSQP